MLVNGQPGSSISAADRGLQYGDGLFETIAVFRGEPLLWQYHMDRLEVGCERLGFPAPDADQLLRESRTVVGECSAAVLKILLTRGIGGRGYTPPSEPAVTRVISCHPLPDYAAECWTLGVNARFCRTRLGINPGLAGLKHLNRLEQVMARREWESATIAEGLMLDAIGRVVEGTLTNLFVWLDDRLVTPDLSHCGVAGVMRRLIMRLAMEHSIPVVESDLYEDQVKSADAVFLTNSLIGIWPVRRLDDIDYDTSLIPSVLARGVEPHCLRKNFTQTAQ